MADMSVWPVVVGGLLTGASALGGVWITSVVAAHRDAALERREQKKRRADKFEELVAAVYEFDHFLAKARQQALGASAEILETLSPFAKVQSIAAVYFPQFGQLIKELDATSTHYLIWIIKARQKNASGEANFLDGFEETYRPYVKIREALLDALQKFAADHFQETPP